MIIVEIYFILIILYLEQIIALSVSLSLPLCLFVCLPASVSTSYWLDAAAAALPFLAFLFM